MIASATFLVLLLARPQDGALSGEALSKTVAYSTAAARLENLLPELAKASGVQMKADADTKDEVVVAQVGDVPLRDLMAKIAEVSGAEWTIRDGVYHLAPSSERLREEEIEETKRTTALVRAEDDRISKELHGRKLWDQAQADQLIEQYRHVLRKLGESQDADERSDLVAQLDRLDSLGPLHQVAERVFLSLDPTVLASIRHGERIVFSSSPTHMQQPLPQASLGFLDGFVAERETIARAISNVDDTQVSQMLSSNPRLPAIRNAVPAKMLVSVKRDDNLMVRVILLDKTGASMADDSYKMAVEHRSVATDGPAIPDREVEYSDATRRTREAIQAVMKPFDPEKAYTLPPDLLKRIYDPEHFDPLSGLPTDMLVSLAKALNAPNLVAVVPDSLLPDRWHMADRFTVSGVRTCLLWKCGMKLDVRDGWMTVSYDYPTFQRTLRTDRAALRDLFAAFRPQSLLTLDDAAAFASRAGDTESPNWSRLVDIYPDPKIGQCLGFSALIPPGLRFYGSLSPSQRAVLREGRTLSAADLGPEQLALLAHGVYRDSNTLQVSPKADSPLGRLPDALLHEPTEVLPNGIPPSTRVELSIFKRTDGLLPLGVGPLVAWGPGDVAGVFLSQERPNDSPYWVRHTPPKLFVPGTSFELLFTVRFVPGAGQACQMWDRRWDKASPGVPYEALPAEFHQEVQKRLEELRKRFGGG